ncbi:MAG: phosphoethanolamine transferase [Brumimicrobium sp.]|nr:phosphoethanolamine transferase [Brumimicrobium sp.]
MRKTFSYIDEILPYDVVLLGLSPILVGSFIDWDLVDFRYIFINLLWILPFTLTASGLRSSIPIKIGSIFIFISGCMEIAHWLIVKGPISTASLLTLLATNFEESKSFLALQGLLPFLILIPYLVLFLFSLRRKRVFIQDKFKFWVISVFALVFIAFTCENAFHQRFIRKATPQFVKTLFSFSEQYGFFKQTEGNTVRKVQANKIDNQGSIFVLILGESLNRSHLSLYGYPRPTTPKLEKRQDIYVFRDVVSPYSNTINSVLSLLTESNLENQKKPLESIDVFDIFSSAGYQTYWLSNQPPYGIWENKVTTLGKKAQHVQFLNLASNSSMEATLAASYDEKVLLPFQKILSQQVNNQFIVIHLMGNHTAYEKRYPSSFSIFSGNTSKEKTIAAYDNAVLYNDFVVDSLLHILQQYSESTNKIVSAIYLSDHGENVYDENDVVGHVYAGKLPKANVEIPLILWLSDAYKHKYPQKIPLIEQNLNAPYVSDDLFYSILDLNQIQTPLFEPSRSIFHKQFNAQRKRILEDGFDYD